MVGLDQISQIKKKQINQQCILSNIQKRPARDTRMTISIIRPLDSDQRKRGVSDYTGM